MSIPDPQGTPSKRRNPWIWVSAALAVVAIALLAWGLNTRSDLDASQDQVDKLESRSRVSRVVGLAAFADLQKRLDVTSTDLASTQADLEAAQKSAAEADQAAAAAEEQAAQADNETDKANAEAAQAKAEVEAANARSSIVVECARAFIAGLGVVVQSGESSDQGADAKKELQGIADTCRTALAGT